MYYFTQILEGLQQKLGELQPLSPIAGAATGIYPGIYLWVFTFLPTGLLPISVRIFSKFREIYQICQ